ncbi:hypothetical protein [Kiloniella sp. EL199]|uniref:hypothetical protein n=1 Tax=Kiloniella sp. EL199 TaxID=2107581 RepID=UPI000EA2C489|nr:hypothetical protein [Kiloniella sp. EL199]
MLRIIAILLFLIFASNVVLGSSGQAVFLGDVTEMLVLFAAVIAFVAMILQKEAVQKEKNKSS